MHKPIFVAIPARDEAERVGPCLLALDAQQVRPDAVVLMLNNSSDHTESIVRALAPALRFRLELVSRDLPPSQASAGHARRLAMEIAAALAADDGTLMTTDADSTAPPDWIRRNLRALQDGADVVCGRAVINPAEAAMIPSHLHDDDAREQRLIALLDNMAWLLDPEPHDPPPRHTEASGASLAVRAEAYHRAGGIPAIRSGEDRAFVRALWMMDAPVRHDPAIAVTVSGRIEGRAEGGMAEAIRRRMVQQDEFTDDLAEPAIDAFRRYALRGRVRRAWRAIDVLRRPDDRWTSERGASERWSSERWSSERWSSERWANEGLAAALALSYQQLAVCLAHQFFGSAWAALEACSPVLRRRRLRFVDVPAELTIAEALLHHSLVPETLAAD